MSEGCVINPPPEWSSTVADQWLDILVVFPFMLPIYLPPLIYVGLYDILIDARILPHRCKETANDENPMQWVRLYFPLDLTTSPLLGTIVLLLTSAIGWRQVIEGTVGTDSISPLDVLAFAFTLGYISNSINATGILRYLSAMVLHGKGPAGFRGHLLYFHFYFALFLLGLLFGNDPVIQMGMLFTAYLTRLSSNISHPKAWLFTQFAVTNVASTILVSSSSTNVIISQAFKIEFAEYTANVVVPVIATVLVLPLFLLYIIFGNYGLIPIKIKTYPPLRKAILATPMNSALRDGIHATLGNSELRDTDDEIIQWHLDPMQPRNTFLDKGSAAVGFSIMLITLIVLLVLTAKGMNDIPVFRVSFPTSVLMLFWDLAWGWKRRMKTRTIAHEGRAGRIRPDYQDHTEAQEPMDPVQCSMKAGSRISWPSSSDTKDRTRRPDMAQVSPRSLYAAGLALALSTDSTEGSAIGECGECGEHVDGKFMGGRELFEPKELPGWQLPLPMVTLLLPESKASEPPVVIFEGRPNHTGIVPQYCCVQRVRLPPTPPSSPVTITEDRLIQRVKPLRTTLTTILQSLLVRLRVNFPTAVAALSYLPFRLIPFALPTFILVQALVSTGWVVVFTRGWEAWATKTGTTGAVAGMGFISVALCNCAGTNIGATILLSRILQEWPRIHDSRNDVPIDERTYWAAVYALAIGVNYGAFSWTFGASLGGLGWQEVLKQRGLHIGKMDFLRNASGSMRKS
ncbi:arsenite efflux transporter [Colletotrichum musicola]|uniref:Arsenite efflux transporter n=1 Tax=Colletotrichum musicola TaxID=2175873 RepID=A0A8H6K4V4_9PEZI|nr:arsenite efflux transporter [Colletotrichum musicola]